MSYSNLLNSFSQPIGSANSLFINPVAGSIEKSLPITDGLKKLDSIFESPLGLSYIGDTLRDTGSSLSSHVASSISDLPKTMNIMASATSVSDTVSKLDGGEGNAACDLFQDAYGSFQKAGEMIDGAIDSIKKTFDSITEELKPFLEAISEFIGKTVSSFGDLIAEFAEMSEGMIETFKTTFSTLIAEISETVSSVVSDVTASIDDLKNSAEQMIASEVASISQAISDITNFSFLQNLSFGLPSVNPCARGVVDSVIKPDAIPSDFKDKLQELR